MNSKIILNITKKVLLILIVTFFVNQTNATDECLIKDAPSEIILNYKKVLSKKVSDITVSSTSTVDNSFLWRQKASLEKTKNDFTRIWKSISAIFNWSWNWWGYHTYWNFYVVKPLYSSIPYTVRRDHDLLKLESEKLVKFQKYLIKKSDFEQSEEITKLIVINEQVLNCFRQQIVDWQKCNIETFNSKESNEVIWDIPKFLWEFIKVYNDDTAKKCWTDFLTEIWDKFNDISQTLKWNWSAFKDWQDAWLMITWNHKDMAKIEKALLIKELSRQWLSANAINKMANNLDKMNACLDDDSKTAFECAKDNNPFTNTMESVKDSFQDLRDWFNNAIETQSKIWDKNRAALLKSSWLKDSPIYQTLELINKWEIVDSTEAEIENLFNFNKVLTEIPDWSTKNLEWKIINSHINLNSAIKTLDSTIEISRKVCKAQHQWVWICK